MVTEEQPLVIWMQKWEFSSRGGGLLRDSQSRLSLSVVGMNSRANYLRRRSVRACFMTCPPTTAMEVVSGISFGQISTQFWA